MGGSASGSAEGSASGEASGSASGDEDSSSSSFGNVPVTDGSDLKGPTTVVTVDDGTNVHVTDGSNVRVGDHAKVSVGGESQVDVRGKSLVRVGKQGRVQAAGKAHVWVNQGDVDVSQNAKVNVHNDAPVMVNGKEAHVGVIDQSTVHVGKGSQVHVHGLNTPVEVDDKAIPENHRSSYSYDGVKYYSRSYPKTTSYRGGPQQVYRTGYYDMPVQRHSYAQAEEGYGGEEGYEGYPEGEEGYGEGYRG